MQEFKNFIGGEWVNSSDGSTFESRNPANPDEIVGVFPLTTQADTRRAIEAARTALPGWANTPPPDRGAILQRASQIVAARLDDLAALLTREEGKTLAEARAEMVRTRDIFHSLTYTPLI
jgi:acyl-CoA reductase-like NAD-dependent aldehyde dehydrogenase